MTIGKKIGIFSDIHLGLQGDSPVWHEIALDFAKWASEMFLKNGINDIIIPGDIFHNRSEIGVNTISTANKFFNYFKDFRLYISTGNHCCYYKDNSEVNSISILSGWDNITIIDKDPKILKFKNKTISLIPWGTELKDIPKTDICFGHFEIQSFYMNSFKVCEHGIESSNILEKSPLVFSGHFHSKDDRSYKKGRIVYVGSPYQQNFGDTDQERGIYIFDVESEDLKFIENTISPKHIKLSLKELKKKKEDPSFLNKAVSNNIISLIIDEEIASEKISLLSTNLQKLNPKHLRIDYKSSEDELVENSKKEEYNSVDIEKNIEDFVNSMDIDHKDDIIEYLTTVYKEITT